MYSEGPGPFRQYPNRFMNSPGPSSFIHAYVYPWIHGKGGAGLCDLRLCKRWFRGSPE